MEVGYIWDSNALILVSIEAIHQDKYQNLKIIYVLMYGQDTLEWEEREKDGARMKERWEDKAELHPHTGNLAPRTAPNKQSRHV